MEDGSGGLLWPAFKRDDDGKEPIFVVRRNGSMEVEASRTPFVVPILFFFVWGFGAYWRVPPAWAAQPQSRQYEIEAWIDRFEAELLVGGRWALPRRRCAASPKPRRRATRRA